MTNDITMCICTTCTLSPKCLRHEDSGVKPNTVKQSYALFQPNDCKYFVDKYAHNN